MNISALTDAQLVQKAWQIESYWSAAHMTLHMMESDLFDGIDHGLVEWDWARYVVETAPSLMTDVASELCARHLCGLFEDTSAHNVLAALEILHGSGDAA